MLIVLSIPLIVACGPKANDNKNANYNALDIANEIPLIATEKKISCVENCYPAVGNLYVQREDSSPTEAQTLTQCVATLIGTDKVITAAHCIPESVRQSPELCSKLVSVSFMENSNPIPCKSLEFASPLENFKVQPDIAIIRIKDTLLTAPLKISPAGFSHGKKYRMLKVRPAENSEANFKQESTSCRASLNNILSPFSSKPDSSVVSLGGCDAIHGDSGSPILDEEGAIVGIFQSIRSVNDPSSEEVLRKLLKLAPIDSLPKQVLATNLARLDEVSATFAFEKEWNTRDGGPIKLSAQTNREIFKNVEKIISTWMERNRDFAWEITKDNDLINPTYSVKPKCRNSIKKRKVLVPLVYITTSFDLNYEPIPKFNTASKELKIGQLSSCHASQ